MLHTAGRHETLNATFDYGSKKNFAVACTMLFLFQNKIVANQAICFKCLIVM